MYKYAFTKKVKVVTQDQNTPKILSDVPLKEEPILSDLDDIPKQEMANVQVEDLVPIDTTPKLSKHDAALADLKLFIASILSAKLDEIKTSIHSRMQIPDDPNLKLIPEKKGKAIRR